MAQLLLVPVVLAAALAAVGFVSWHIIRRFEKAHEQLLSLSAGILITLILFRFIPILNTAGNLSLVYTLLLAGFVTFHLGEKWVYTHAPRNKVQKAITEVHAVGFAFDRAIIGIALVLIALLGTLVSVLVIFIPFLIHTIAGAHSISHIRRKLKNGEYIASGISGAVIIGALAALSLRDVGQVYEVFAFVVGILLYLTVRDVVPKLHEGKPTWFVLGIIGTLLIFFLTGVA